jgi:acetyltransferase-like isoleucine patch superfamily enzyme
VTGNSGVGYDRCVRHRSHGTGEFRPEQLAACGADCVFEADVLIFHPENVHLGRNVYVGHRTMLKGYYNNAMRIGDETWIGQMCFFHSAGGIEIGARVGIGPGVIILTSTHAEHGRAVAPLFSPVETAPVHVEDEVNIGVGAVLMPGVHVGRGAKIGAGAVVTHDVAAYSIVAGAPARFMRERPE